MILYGYRVHIYIYTNIDAHSWLKRQLKYCFFAKRGSVPTKVVTVLIEFGLRGSTILSFLFEYTVHCRRASPSQDFEIMDQTEDMKLVGGSERQIHKRSLVICTRIALNKRQVCTCLHCIFSIFEWHFLRAIFGGDTCNSCWASLAEPAFLSQPSCWQHVAIAVVHFLSQVSCNEQPQNKWQLCFLRHSNPTVKLVLVALYVADFWCCWCWFGQSSRIFMNFPRRCFVVMLSDFFHLSCFVSSSRSRAN